MTVRRMCRSALNIQAPASSSFLGHLRADQIYQMAFLRPLRAREFEPTKVRLNSRTTYSAYYLRVGTFNRTWPPPLGMYVTFGLPESDCTIALLVSIFRNVTNALPAETRAREMVAAASASPSARITAACRSCSA